MSVNALSTNVTVSGQIHVSDLSFLSDQNVEVIVCNRPDHEDNPQPTFAEIAPQEKRYICTAVQEIVLPYYGRRPRLETAEWLSPLKR